MSKVLLIIPAFNEEGNIKNVIESLKIYEDEFDYIIINDGSSDNTSKICHKEKYNIIDLPVNLGLAGAFATGVKYAIINSYDYIAQFDADGQHRPCYISEMKSMCEQGYDIVIASRKLRIKDNFLKYIGSRLISLAIFITTKKWISDPTSGLRMYNKKIMLEFISNKNYAPEPDTIAFLLKKGATVQEIPAVMDERQSGVSYLNPIRAIQYMYVSLISILFIQSFRR